MTSEELYQTLLDRSVKLSVAGEMLSFTAPDQALTPELIGLMKRHKRALIELVKRDSMNTPAPALQYAASYGQEALWLLHRENPRDAAYNTAAAIRLLSPLDIASLTRALAKLVHRHDALRTTFRSESAGLQAVVHAAPPIDFECVCAEAWSEEQLHAAVQADYAKPFDLTSGPLMRVRLFQQANDRAVLLFTLHHIIFDAASLWILQNELQRLYRCEVSGEACLQPVLPAHYSDFVQSQRALPNTPAGQEQWKFWEQELGGNPVPGELPWSFSRPRHGQRSGATVHFKIDPSLSSDIRKLAKRCGATPFVTTLAMFQTLLHRHSNQRDFVVGTTTAGRSQRQFANCIGYFVNILPIRCDLGQVEQASSSDPSLQKTTKTSNLPTFAQLVQQTKSRTLGAMQHGDFPFPLMVDRLKPVRELNAPPLCRVMFGLQKPHAFEEVAQLLEGCDTPVDWGGLQATGYELNQQEGQFDLTFELYEAQHSFCGVVKYDRNLLSDQTAKLFGERFVELARAITANPDLPLDSYAIATEEEQKLIHNWSQGQASSPPEFERFDQWFEASASQFAAREAITFGDQTLTYAEVNAQSNALARVLREFGVKPGGAVACNTRRQSAIPILYLAALKCGAALVPIAPDSPPQRLAKIIEECRPDLLVTSERAFDSNIEALLQTRGASIESLLTASLAKDTSNLEEDFSEDTTAYIIYTSGSNGIPKGVKVSHRAICHHLGSMADVYEMTERDAVLQFCEWTFDPSIEQMFVPWSVGGKVVFRGESMLTCEGFWRLVQEERLTVVNLPPSFLVECSTKVPAATALRLLIVGGDVFPSQVLSAWSHVDVKILNAYGPTEAVITATTQDVRRLGTGQRIAIGKPKPGSLAFVCDAHGKQLPVGVPGELYLGGPMLSSGYVSAAPQSQANFCSMHIPGYGEQSIYRTGDLVRWNDAGELEFLGRIDRQIKIRGFRVELGEIENALLEHPQISKAYVQLVDEGQNAYLAAYVTEHPGQEINRDEVLHHLKSSLPIYMLPERLGVIDQMPLNSSGKIDASKLPELPRPTPRATQAYVAPRNQLEETMAQVWSEVLEVEAIGIHDDFYQLGGGSLQSLRIVSRLAELGVGPKDAAKEISPQLLFQYVTIAELASLLKLTPSRDAVAPHLTKDAAPADFVHH